MGWEYALAWLTVLPFEITAAGLTIDFWRDDINIGVWITVFLFLLVVVQFFGVRGYGEGEFLKPCSSQWNGRLMDIWEQSNSFLG